MAQRRTFEWGAINDQIKKADSKKTYNKDDENEYKVKLGTDGTFQAIVRFLPPPLGETLPFIKIHSHGFLDQNGWFINNCPSTLNLPCPVCKANGKIWKENDEDTARDLVGDKKRQMSFWANILVVRDPQNADNEGKVFKYRYGVKIHDKIMGKLQPSNPDIDEMVPVHDYNLGANFKLDVKKVGGYPNYDQSGFQTPSPIGNKDGAYSDEDIERIESQMLSLESIIATDQFKSYADLATEYSKKTGEIISTSEDGAVPVAPVATTVTATQEILKDVKAPAIEESAEADDFFNKLRGKKQV